MGEAAQQYIGADDDVFADGAMVVSPAGRRPAGCCAVASGRCCVVAGELPTRLGMIGVRFECGQASGSPVSDVCGTGDDGDDSDADGGDG